MKKHGLLRNRIILALDIFGIAMLYMFSIIFMFGMKQGTVNFMKFIPVELAITISFCFVFYVANIYRVLWTYAGARDYIRLSMSVVIALCASIVTTLAVRYIRADLYSANTRDVFRLGALTSMFFGVYAVFIRMVIRVITRVPSYHEQAVDPDAKKVLIVGAGSAASILVRDIPHNSKLNFHIIGFVDDDSSKISATLGGYPVLGNRYDIPNLCKKHMIDEILLAMPSACATDKNEIVEICSKTKAKIKFVPAVDQAISRDGGIGKIRNVQIEDLLDRQPIILDNDEISAYIEDKVVMVTGGGGSIGSELCRQIMKYNPRNLVIVDIYENNAYDLQMELNRHYPENCPTVLIASVRDKARLEAIFEEYKPYIVFHAAAHKHVPLMEQSPTEAIKNNVFGTLNVAECADKFGARRFVMISTDKAVNPTNIMGATKRMCEMVVQAMQKISSTEFVAVRFGNVLGSNGSVIPLFKKQIEEGGPVTVTHKDITRFFMTIPEAAQLVIQAGSMAKEGQLFVLDMGKPIKIYDLAVNMIKLSGLVPDDDIKIEEIGLRPGEKLFEELLIKTETLEKTDNDMIFVETDTPFTREEVDEKIAILLEAVDSSMNDLTATAVVDAMKGVVPTYHDPEEVNQNAETTEEMKEAEEV